MQFKITQRRPLKGPTPAPGQAERGPTILGKASNAGAAARRVLGALARGSRIKATPEETAARLAICPKCPDGKLKNGVCQDLRCGCVVERKAKFATEDCPRGHWPALTRLDANPIRNNHDGHGHT
jgi:hypothetical protein